MRDKLFVNFISKLFYILFFFTPLILFPKSSELFEFNKIVFIYIITGLLFIFWLARMVLAKKIIYRRTILDWPLILFFISQILSTVFSIDSRTSLLGYYGRFNGGLISVLSYLLLYWTFVSNMDSKKTIKSLYFLLASAFLVSGYGILQRLGIDKDIWVQDVQNRVFSTLGQPNWLATFLIAYIPIGTILCVTSKNVKALIFGFTSLVFYLALLFTKSRSGLIGFVSADLLLCLYLIFYKNKGLIKKELLKRIGIIHIGFLVLTLLFGTPWSQNIYQLISKTHTPITTQEPGGTESGDIRKIVWKGAVNVWSHYPFYGSGVETFAYSFYQYRPSELNLVSEWDFLFNKAHNEFLNYAATTGTVGLLAYLFLIVSTFALFIKSIKGPSRYLILGFVSAYSGILVANFFGFSTTTSSLAFFLFPAFATALVSKSPLKLGAFQKNKLGLWQLTAFACLLLLGSFILFSCGRYWMADFYYAKAEQQENQGNFEKALRTISTAISVSNSEPVFYSRLSQIQSNYAVKTFSENKVALAQELAKKAVLNSQKAILLSPRNLALIRSRETILVRLSNIDPLYLHLAKDAMLLETGYSPTDAKLYYNLGLAYARIEQKEDAILTLEKTVYLKDNYKEARLALALLYINANRPKEAEKQLQYILNNIDPNDPIVRQQLQELSGK